MRMRRKAIVLLLMSGALLGVRSAAAQDAPDSVKRIVLERIGCYGNCPGYRVTVSADGKIRFEGTLFSAKHGRKQVAPTEFQSLLQQFLDLQFTTMDSDYTQTGPHCGMFATDMPGFVLTVEGKSIIHRVRVYNGCGFTRTADTTAATRESLAGFRTLGSLAAAVDSLANSSRWYRLEWPRQ